MKQNTFTPFAITLLLLLTAYSCAPYHRMQGNMFYEQMAFRKASDHYEKAVAKKASPRSMMRLADCYRMMRDSRRAQAMYGQVVKLPEARPEHYYYYAQALMQNGKYEEAKVWIARYMDGRPDDASAQHMLAACDSIPVFQADTVLYKVERLPESVNSPLSDFSPAYYGEGIVFASEKSEKAAPRKAAWTGQPYLDLYYTEQSESGEWTPPVKLDGQINSLFNEGPLVFSPDGKYVYFTRNNYDGGRRGRSRDKVNHLKLYRATRDGDKWKDITELPFNSDEYSNGHPALSPDGTVLYFVSDRPGGVGGSDIYMSRHKYADVWETPVNLGPGVNTAGNELFPYMDEQGDLYFSSDGLGGMGGLDVFVAHADAEGFGAPANLRSPINSHADDFGFITHAGSGKGYFSSNRGGGPGSDELFSFLWIPPVYRLEGQVVSKRDGSPVSAAIVQLRDPIGNVLQGVKSDDSGRFEFDLERDRAYRVYGNRKGMFSDEDSLSTAGERFSKTWYVQLELDEVEIGKPIVLQDIYYDYDKSFIREDAKPSLDKLVKIMVDNPNIRVELSSHTDSRGSDSYNEKLSQRRAQAAVDYIVSQGISPKRIKAMGYGESRLVNDCDDGVNCEEEAHQLNRRTEFTVVRQ